MTNKKLKITEAQYEMLIKQQLLETPFDSMVKQNIEVGDVVSINWKGSKNNFKVIDNNNGQVIMDNIDKGSTNINNRYFMSFTSLDGDDLEMRKVNKVKEPDKLNDIKSWSPVTVKDITNIEIFRDGQLVDTVDPVSPTAAKQQKNGKKPEEPQENQDFMDNVNNDLAIIMEQLAENKGLNLIIGQGYVNFCCVDVTKPSWTLDINKQENTILPNLNNWDSYVLNLVGDPEEDNLFVKNQNVVSTSDGVTYNLKFQAHAGTNYKDITIKAIKGVNVLPNCKSSDEDYQEPEEKPEATETDDEKRADAQVALQMILQDKDLQDAFYKQPGFWEMFKAELTGKKAVGSGIITVLDIMRKVADAKVIKNVGKGFNVNKIADFIPLQNVLIKYRDDNDVIHDYELPMVEDEITVRRHSVDSVSQVLQKQIEGTQNYLRILVKHKTDDPNVKRCDVQVGVLKNQSDKFVEKGITHDVKIKFLESEGYTAQKQQQPIQTN